MEKLKTRFRPAWQWITHDFFKVSAGLFSIGVVGSVLNMLCRILLGRMLTSEQYGEMEALMQVGAYVGVPISAIQSVVAREVAHANGAGFPGRVGDILWTVGKHMGWYILGVMALMVITAPVVRDFFKLNSVWPVLATAGLVLSMFLISVVSGGLQGSHRFWKGGVAGLAGPASRIALSWALIRQGFGATGALAAQAGSGLIMGVAALAFCLDLIRTRARKAVPLLAMYRFMWPTMITLWLASTIGGIDIFIVKRLFSPWEAGDYARVSAVVRLALFLNGSLTVTLFPWVASEQAGGRKTSHLLVKALAAGLGISLVAAVMFTAFPGFLLHIFYNEISADMRNWVKLLGWALIPGSLFNILFQYHLARRDFRFLIWLVPAGTAYAALLILFRQSIPAMIVAMGAGSLMVVMGLILPLRMRPRAEGVAERQAGA